MQGRNEKIDHLHLLYTCSHVKNFCHWDEEICSCRIFYLFSFFKFMLGLSIKSRTQAYSNIECKVQLKHKRRTKIKTELYKNTIKMFEINKKTWSKIIQLKTSSGYQVYFQHLVSCQKCLSAEYTSLWFERQERKGQPSLPQLRD